MGRGSIDSKSIKFVLNKLERIRVLNLDVEVKRVMSRVLKRGDW